MLTFIKIKYYSCFQRVEPWEAGKTESDWERFYWDLNVSKENISNLLMKINEIDKTVSKMKNLFMYLISYKFLAKYSPFLYDLFTKKKKDFSHFP